MKFSAISYFFPVAFLSIVLFLIYNRKESFRNPAIFIMFLWIVILVMHGIFSYIQFIPLYPSYFTSNVLAIMSVLAFAGSFLIARAIFSSQHIPQSGPLIEHPYDQMIEFRPSQKQKRRDIWLDWAMIGFSIFVLYRMYQTASNIIGTRDVFSQLQMLRSELNYGEADWGLVEYGMILVIVSATYIGARNYSLGIKADIRSYILLILALSISVISSQRTSILFVLVSFFFARSRLGVPPVKSLVVSSIIFIISFIFLGFLLGKVGNKNSNFIDAAQSGWESFVFYILSPLSAFSHTEIWNQNWEHAGLTTRFFLNIFKYLGFTDEGGGTLVLPFVYIPLPTNVYSFSYVAIADFGFFFILYFVVIGIMLGFEFSFGRKRIFHRSLQAFLYYPIIMSVFSDQFFTIFSQWVQIIFWLLVLQYVYRDGLRSPPQQRPARHGVTLPVVQSGR